MASSIPLLGLRAFVEATKHGSIKEAALSLNVTAGAVSQQIKILEERIGNQLFIREKSGLTLTASGQQAYPLLAQAFDQIEQSFIRLKDSKNQKKLTISTTPTFAASWLVPRLKNFTDLQPDIEIHIQPSECIVDLREEPIDISLRQGFGTYSYLYSERLMAPVFIPVISPDLLNNGPSIHTAIDCLQYPLLQDMERANWTLWFNNHGVKNQTKKMQKGASFGDECLLLQAALTGQGIALLPEMFIKNELNVGKLVRLLDETWPSQFYYYALTLTENRERSEVRSFLTWLQHEVQKEKT